jgi:ubiquinone/menaquinone biosynthesis C-methylase UbiE
MQTLPFPDGHFYFVWCRDVVTQVDDLEAALRETARVLSADGHTLVYATLRTDRMNSVEANLHWERFQFLRRLLPTVYVLGKD